MNNNGTLSYPVFKANQVLTDGHLNAAVSYLETQTLLTRATLIGTGIICGFEPAIDGDDLTISPGCGVTTEGYLVVIRETSTFTHYRLAKLSKKDLPCERDLPGLGKDVLIDGKTFDPVIYELFSSDAHPDNPNPTKPLTEPLPEADDALSGTLAEKIVVLLFHIDDEDRDTCLFDCDEAGTQRIFTVRTLVMDQEDAEKVIRAGFGLTGDLDAEFNGKYNLPDLCLKRFGYSLEDCAEDDKDPPGLYLHCIKNLSNYLSAYERVCTTPSSSFEPPKELFEDIADAYKRTNELFSPFFTGEHPKSDDDFTALKTTLEAHFAKVKEQEQGTQLGIQYFYDYLKDLILAYDELRTATFDLMDDCLPSCERYPRHLMLGEPDAPASCPPSVYRTYFTQPPIYNGNARRLQEVRLLYERMKVMTTNFKIPETEPDKSEIKITASRLAPAPLGTRAIPFYYDQESTLYQSWDFERTRRCRAAQNRSYHAEAWQGPSQDQLLCTIDPYDFYQIEGHLGKEYEAAFKDIQALRKKYNLAFDVIALKIGLIADSENIQFDFVFEDLEAFYNKCKEELLCLLAEIEDNADLPDDDPDDPIVVAIEALKTGLTKRLNPDYVKDQDATLGAGEESQDEFLYGDYYDLARLSEDNHYEEFSASHTTVFEWAEDQEQVRLPYFDCTPESVKPVLDAYDERVLDIQRQFLFHHFVKKHPGTEHLAGVPRGGTFILVYVNEGEEAAVLGALNDAQRLALEKADALGQVSSAQKELLDIVMQEAQEATEAFEEQSASATRALQEAIEALSKLDDTEGEIATLDERIEAETSSRTRLVVGDFCLPYNCCSDAPPLSFVVSQPRPIVLLEQISYCINDPDVYAFNLHPPNGLLVGPGVDSSAENVYQFDPDHDEVIALPPLEDGRRLATFTYWADGGVDTLTVEILPLRDAGFTTLDEIYCIDLGNPLARIELEPKTEGGTFTPEGPPIVEEEGLFFFDPNLATPSEEIDITYSLLAGDDGCANSFTQTVTVFEVPDASFTGLDAEYCVTDEAVSLIGADGEDLTSAFAGDGVSEVDGVFVFNPAAAGVGTFTVTHTVTDTVTGCSNEAEQTVTVHSLPDASFTLDEEYCVTDGAVTLGEAGLDSTFEGDGVIEVDGVFVFNPAEAGEGTATITHTVTDPATGCSNEAEQTVTVHSLPDASFRTGRPTFTPSDLIIPIRNIQPDDLDSVVFTWKMTTDENEAPKETAFDDGVVRINRDDLEDVEVIFLTMVGTLDPCTSGPITVQVQLPRQDVKEIDSLDGSEGDGLEGGGLEGGGLGVGGGRGGGVSFVTDISGFEALSEEPAAVPEEPSEISSEAEAVLNQRMAQYQNRVNTLAAEDGNLKNTKSFKLTNLFLLMGASAPVADVLARYEEVASTLASTFKRAKEERKATFVSLIEAVTHSMLDRMVVSAPTVPASLSGSIDRLGKAGVDLDALATTWQADDLKAVLPAANVEDYLDALRSPE